MNLDKAKTLIESVKKSFKNAATLAESENTRYGFKVAAVSEIFGAVASLLALAISKDGNNNQDHVETIIGLHGLEVSNDVIPPGEERNLHAKPVYDFTPESIDLDAIDPTDSETEYERSFLSKITITSIMIGRRQQIISADPLPAKALTHTRLGFQRFIADSDSINTIAVRVKNNSNKSLRVWGTIRGHYARNS